MPEAADPAFDRDRADAFGKRLLSTLNAGSLCLMTSVGHRTGLFDVMCGMPPSTSSQIAARAGLNERYEREWLGAMVTGGVVEVDGRTFRAREKTRSTQRSWRSRRNIPNESRRSPRPSR